MERSECVIEIDGRGEDSIIDLNKSCEFVTDEISE